MQNRARSGLRSPHFAQTCTIRAFPGPVGRTRRRSPDTVRRARTDAIVSVRFLPATSQRRALVGRRRRCSTPEGRGARCSRPRSRPPGKSPSGLKARPFTQSDWFIIGSPDPPPRRGLVEHDGSRFGAGGDHVAIGTEREADDGFADIDRRDIVVGLWIPHLHDSVEASRDEQAPIGAEGQGHHVELPPDHVLHRPAPSHRCPRPDEPGPPAGSQQAPVGTESDRIDAGLRGQCVGGPVAGIAVP